MSGTLSQSLSQILTVTERCDRVICQNNCDRVTKTQFVTVTVTMTVTTRYVRRTVTRHPIYKYILVRVRPFVSGE